MGVTNQSKLNAHKWNI